MSDLRILPLNKSNQTASPYIVLLTNGERLLIHADNVNSAVDDDSNLLQYIFYKKNRPVVILDAVHVSVIMAEDAVDADLAVRAIRKKPGRPKKVE